MTRKPRIALIDWVHKVAYSRTLQRNSAGYTEDPELQAVLDDKGFLAAKRFAMCNYHGVMVAVLV